MASSSKRKGDRFERLIVDLHRAAGIAAERVPLSGAVGGSYAGDVVVDGDLRAEAKARQSGGGFRVLERWLADNDLLFVKRDRQAPLVVLSWSTYERLMRDRD